MIVLRPPSQAIAEVVACLDGAIRALATEAVLRISLVKRYRNTVERLVSI